MSFIQADEFIILCDYPQLNADNLKRIREAGVKTALESIWWEKVEVTPGVYDWSGPDALVERAKNAGIKTLFRCHDNAPAFFPEDWYIRSANGMVWRNLHGYGGPEYYTILSPWCKEAVEREQAFMRLCNERYHNEWAQCYASTVHGGEAILPGMHPSYHDKHALISFREYANDVPADLPTYASMQSNQPTVDWLRQSLWDYVKEQQNIFPEIWFSLVERNTSFAESFECGPRSGNWLMKDLCDRLPSELNKELNVMLYEVNRDGGNQGALNNVQGHLGNVWIGSQYSEGLRTYTTQSIDAGLRGFVTRPATPGREGIFDSSMVESLQWSVAQWQAARL